MHAPQITKNKCKKLSVEKVKLKTTKVGDLIAFSSVVQHVQQI